MAKGVFMVCPSMRGINGRIGYCIHGLRDYLRDTGLICPLPLVSNKSPLYLARSWMADRFIESGLDVMFSVDDDTEFRLEDGLALITSVLDGHSHFSGASYDSREINEEAFRASCKDDAKSFNECLEDAAQHYCGHLPLYTGSKELTGFTCADHQFIECDWVGGGMFCMSRQAVLDLLSAYPGMMLFDNAIGDDGIWQSDDIVIGGRYKAIGGQSYLDTSARLVHWGSFGYRSALDRHLREGGYTFQDVGPRKTHVDTRVQPAAIRNARYEGIRLRALRERKGLTRKELADAIGAPLGYIEKVESFEVTCDSYVREAWLKVCGFR
jgi:hypothetical protein